MLNTKTNIKSIFTNLKKYNNSTTSLNMGSPKLEDKLTSSLPTSAQPTNKMKNKSMESLSIKTNKKPPTQTHQKAERRNSYTGIASSTISSPPTCSTTTTNSNSSTPTLDPNRKNKIVNKNIKRNPPKNNSKLIKFIADLIDESLYKREGVDPYPNIEINLQQLPKVCFQSAILTKFYLNFIICSI